MLTGSSYKRLVVIIGCLLASVSAISQDTVNINPFGSYWTKPRIIPKIGVGAQEIAFAEVGIQYHTIYVHPLTLGSMGPYFTIDACIKDREPIFGPKIGYEVTAGLVGLAADMTYYTDFERESLVVTPKAGVSILGFANLFYGYNILLSQESFELISQNRFSLVFNVNRDFFNLKGAEKQRVGAR